MLEFDLRLELWVELHCAGEKNEHMIDMANHPFSPPLLILPIEAHVS